MERFPRELGNEVRGGFFLRSFCKRFAGLGFGLRMTGFVGSGVVSGYDDSGFGF